MTRLASESLSRVTCPFCRGRLYTEHRSGCPVPAAQEKRLREFAELMGKVAAANEQVRIGSGRWLGYPSPHAVITPVWLQLLFQPYRFGCKLNWWWTRNHGRDRVVYQETKHADRT